MSDYLDLAQRRALVRYMQMIADRHEEVTHIEAGGFTFRVQELQASDMTCPKCGTRGCLEDKATGW